MAGFEQVYTEGRDEMAWIRHIYEQMRPAWEAQQLTLPDFDAFWERGHVALPEPPRDASCCSSSSAPTPRRIRSRDASGKLELHSEALAGFGYADCPPHPAWLPPAEWLGAEAAARVAAPCDLPAGGPAAFAAGPVERRARGRDRRPRTGPHASGRRGARGIGQGTWCACTTNAAPAWEAPTWTRRGARGGGHGHGRLVRPARRGAGAPRQSERADRDEGTSRLAQGCSALSALVQAEKWAGGPEPVRVFEPPALARLAG